MPRLHRVFGFLLIVLTATAAGAQPNATTNVLMVVYDDLDFFGDLEPYGANPAELQTPFSNLTAAQGKKLQRFYSNAGICSPARIGYLTGLYPTQLGFSWVTGDTSRRGVPGSEPTLARLFAGRGYATGAFGKWHAGRNAADNEPLGAGFQTSAIDCTYTNIGVPSQDEGIVGLDFGDTYKDALFCSAPLTVLPDSGTTFATTYTVDKALSFIADALDSPAGQPPGVNAAPFFAQLWLHAPHTPLTCPPGYTCPACDPTEPDPMEADFCSNADKRVFYDAMIDQAETQLMRIHDDLVKRGEWSDTVVIVTSDNGGVGAWQEPTSTLKGAKGGVYERAVRVPFLIRGPGIAPGVVDEPIIGHDVLQTLAAYFGETLAGYDGSGVSFEDLLVGDGSGWTGGDRPLFWELRPTSSPTQHALFYPWLRYAVRKEVQGKPWKLTQEQLYGGGVIPALYDFQNDEGEANNMTWLNPTVRNHLLDELSTWRVTTNAFVPEVDTLVGSVTQNGDAFTFTPPAAGQPHGMVELVDHPVLTVDNQDLSVSFTFTPSQLGAAARLVERRDSWSVMLRSDDRLLFQVRQGGAWRRVSSKVPIVVGTTYRVTATAEISRGLALYVDDVLARLRVKLNPVAETDFPVTVGRHVFDADPFLGTLSDLVVHPITLRTEDLELGGVYGTGFEAGDDMPFTGVANGGTVAVTADAAFRGGLGLRHVASANDGYTLPFAGPAAVVTGTADDLEFQLSAWVRGDGGEDLVSLYLFCLDASGGYTWDPRAFSFSHHLAIDEWRRIVHQHQCPSGTQSLSFRLDNDNAGQTVDWDDIRIGRVGDARLNIDFEGETAGQHVQAIFAADGFDATDTDAHTGNLSMRMPFGTESSIHVLPYGGDNHFVTSFRARKEGSGSASVCAWFYCFDTANNPLAVSTGNCPTGAGTTDQSCIRSFPAALGTDWQHYRLWASCPFGTSKTGIRLETDCNPNNTGPDSLIDDLTVSITSLPN